LDQPGFAARGNFYGGEAATVYGETASGFQAAPGRVDTHGQLDGFRRRLDALDRSRFFDNSREHV
jgi:hypothetical protein